jgi:hypothetical protein
MIPLIAAGSLVAGGAAAGLVSPEPGMAWVGISCSLAATVGVAALLRTRNRGRLRELALECSTRRRQAVELAGRVAALRAVVDELTAEVERLRDAPSVERPVQGLSRELFEEAAAALESLRQAGEHRAPAALAGLRADGGTSEVPVLEVSVERELIDLTAHDDTAPLRVAPVRQHA